VLNITVKYYNTENWQKISEYTNYRNIHLLNRAQIIDDAVYFLMKNELSLSEFLKLVKYLEKETNYVAWYPMIKALEHMSYFFHFSFIEDKHVQVNRFLLYYNLL